MKSERQALLENRIAQLQGIAQSVIYIAADEHKFKEPMTAKELERLHRIELGMVLRGLSLNVPEWRFYRYLGGVYQNANGNPLTPKLAQEYREKATDAMQLKILLFDEFPELKKHNYA